MTIPTYSDGSVVPDHVRAAIYAGHIGQVVIFCDGCGVQDKADYTGETREDRFESARRHLAETKGWDITKDVDLCPSCKGAEPAPAPSPTSTRPSAERGAAAVDDPTRPDRRRLLTWDWAEQPNMDKLADIVLDLSHGHVRMQPADTGDDQHAWLIATYTISPEDASEAYRAYLTGDDHA
jgi:hypothetical protein